MTTVRAVRRKVAGSDKPKCLVTALFACILACAMTLPTFQASQAHAAAGTVSVSPGTVTTATTEVKVTVAGCNELEGGTLYIGTAASSVKFTSWVDTDDVQKIDNQSFAGDGTYTFVIPSGKLAAGKKFVAYVYHYDTPTDSIKVEFSTPIVITEASAEPPATDPEKLTPEAILKDCSVELTRPGGGEFKEADTSAQVSVKLHNSLKQAYLSIVAYPTNSTYDPDNSINKRLWAGYIKDGETKTCTFNRAFLPLQPGYSVVATLNIPVGEDWFKPSNSQPIRVVDEQGQGIEPYDYPEAWLTDSELIEGATKAHVSLTADKRLFQHAKDGKTEIVLFVGMYPENEEFDFESQNMVRLYDNPNVTETMDSVEINLKEPLKAGWRVRAVTYWKQNVDVFIPKGNDYESIFNKPDDSLVVKDSGVVVEPRVVLGEAYANAKTLSATLSGDIPAATSLVLRAYDENETNFTLQGGTFVASKFDKVQAGQTTLAPAANSLQEDKKLVGFLLNDGKVVGQSNPVTIKAAPAAEAGNAIAVEPSVVSEDAAGVTVSVSGYDDYQGGFLFVGQGPTAKDGDSVMLPRLGSQQYTGAGTYSFTWDKGSLTPGKHLVVNLYKYDSTNDTTKYAYAEDIIIAKSQSGEEPAPDEPSQTASLTIEGSPKAGDKTLDVALNTSIPESALLLVKSYGVDTTKFSSDKGTAHGTLLNPSGSSATVSLNTALEANTKVVCYLISKGEALAQSEAVLVAGEAKVADPTIKITNDKITAGMTRAKVAYTFDDSIRIASIALYQFDGETLDVNTATKISESTQIYYSKLNDTISLGRQKIIPGKRLQAVITAGDKTAYSNVIEVQPSPNWGTPEARINAKAVGKDASAIPLNISYADEYLAMSDYYCNVTVYAFPATYSDEDFESLELHEKPDVARVVAYANNNSYGSNDQTRGVFDLSLVKSAELKEGERLIAKLRLPHTEWEDEEQDFLSVSVPVGTTTIPVDADNPAAPGDDPIRPGKDDPATPGTVIAVPTVEGTTGVSASGSLSGASIPEGAKVSLSANQVTSGSSHETLMSAIAHHATTGDSLGIYEVAMMVNGEEVHDNFGTLTLNFPVDAQYNDCNFVVWHLHNDGSLTSEKAVAKNGSVGITVSDLSTFALAEEMPSPQNPSEEVSENGDSTDKTDAAEGNVKTETAHATDDAGKVTTTTTSTTSQNSTAQTGDSAAPLGIVVLCAFASVIALVSTACTRKMRRGKPLHAKRSHWWH